MNRYLITGAAGGMGRALCTDLLREGHEVWGIVRKKTEEEPGFHPVVADLQSTEALEDAVKKVAEEAGTLDAIIHMAGIYDLDSLAEMEESAFLRDFDINVFGAFRTNRLFLPLLKEKGRIVIITSELAPLDPLPFTGIYAVTKAALEKYALSLQMELQMLGHDVIVIRPGAVDTGMLPESRRKLDLFCEKTALYRTNAARFRSIVEHIEARSIPPEALSRLVLRALTVRDPRPVYTINRNPLLLLMDALPRRLQLRIIRRILR